MEHRIQRKGITKNEIMNLIMKGQGKTTWSDLLRELGIAKPTLLEHLNDLRKEGNIISKRKGKRSFYQLTDEAWKNIDARVLLFTLNIENYINSEFAAKDDKKLQESSEKELLTELARKISAAIL